MVIIDTNVLAYLLIQGDRTRSAQDLYRMDARWRSESFILIEFSNILATYQRSGALSANQAQALLTEAQDRLDELIDVPHGAALDVARRFDVSAYDARFLAAAELLEEPLVTEDTRLRAAAPGLTRSIKESIESR